MHATTPAIACIVLKADLCTKAALAPLVGGRVGLDVGYLVGVTEGYADGSKVGVGDGYLFNAYIHMCVCTCVDMCSRSGDSGRNR